MIFDFFPWRNSNNGQELKWIIDSGKGWRSCFRKFYKKNYVFEIVGRKQFSDFTAFLYSLFLPHYFPLNSINAFNYGTYYKICYSWIFDIYVHLKIYIIYNMLYNVLYIIYINNSKKKGELFFWKRDGGKAWVHSLLPCSLKITSDLVDP